MKKVKMSILILGVVLVIGGIHVYQNHQSQIRTLESISKADPFLPLMPDGTLVGWGNPDCFTTPFGSSGEFYSYKDRQVMLTNVVEVHESRFGAVALDTSNRLYAWGGTGSERLLGKTPPEGDYRILLMEDVRAVSLGTFDTAVVKTDGSLWTWGSYITMEKSEASPQPVNIMNGVKDVYSADTAVYAVTDENEVYYWQGNPAFSEPVHMSFNLDNAVEIMDIDWVEGVSLLTSTGDVFTSYYDNGMWKINPEPTATGVKNFTGSGYMTDNHELWSYRVDGKM